MPETLPPAVAALAVNIRIVELVENRNDAGSLR
jgi:hypothetical protein